MTWIDLGPLPDRDIATIVGGLNEFGPADLNAAVALAEGNALAAVQLATAMRLGDGISTPGAVDEAMSAAWASALDSTRVLLWVAALIGRRAPFGLLMEVLSTLGQSQGTAVDAAVLDARRSGLVTVNEHDLVFRHELERRWVASSVPPVLRRRTHVAVAEALQGSRGRDAPAVRMAEIARHWSAAGAHRESAMACLDALDTVDGPLSSPEVLDHLEQVIKEVDQLVEVPTNVIDRLPSMVPTAARAARWAGQCGRGAALLRTIVGRLDDESAMLAWERIGWLERESGDRTAAAAAYVRALQGRTTGRGHIRALAGSAAFHLTAFELDEAAKLCREGLSLCGEEVSAERASLLCTRGVVRSCHGDVDGGLADLALSKQLADDSDSPEEYWRYLGNATYVLQNAGRADEAADLAIDGLRRAEEAGILSSTTVLPLLGNTACALLALGRWDDALDLLDKVDLTNSEPGDASAVALIIEAEIRTCRGDFESADRVLLGLEQFLNRTHAPDMVAQVHRIRADWHYWKHDLVSAAGEAQRGVERLDDDLGEHVLQVHRVAARVLMDSPQRSRTDRGAEAARLHERVEQIRSRVAEPSVDAIADLATIRAELSRTGPNRDGQEWTDAVIAWKSASDPFWEAYCWFRLAEAIAPADRARAARVLRQVRMRSCELGAAPLVRAIDGLAARTRLSIGVERQVDSSETPFYGLALTPREAAVLGELAQGLTNRQIARRLAISERTVGVRVSHILAKLGVGSRVEAAAIAFRVTAAPT